MKVKIALLAMLALFIGGSGLATAQLEENSVHFSVLGGYIFPTNKSLLDNGPAILGGLGYNFDRNWGVELLGTFAPSLDNDGPAHTHRGRLWKRGNQGNADVSMARLSAVYHIDTSSNFVPYLSLGVGGQWIKRDAYADYNSIAAAAALGFKYFFNDTVALRVEASDTYGFRRRDYNTTDPVTRGRLHAPVLAAGLTFQFGGAPKIGDEDKDGVNDNLDKCPGTPSGYTVDANGCPVTVTINLLINFDFNKAIVKPEYYTEVQKLAEYLNSHPLSKTVVEGHTDGRGNDGYNLKLSQKRADAVRDSLVDQFNIDPSRVESIGYGKSRPIADNATEAGRAENRRVVGVISGQDTGK
ncbi:MAG: OmpA family protein [Deltaproteobacteria bacterium]|jgi:OOP family OmpA-OmpF porin|nr:OmpA family protein [Deltaproteobacteria bacterium]